MRIEAKKGKETMSKLLDKILSKENMNLAYKKVKANKGASGIDDVTVEEVYDYIKENWDSIKEKILKRKYKPQPVLRVEIPKPNGGVRKLGIPTVMDRIIEQAVVQVITPIVEPYFSDYSYGSIAVVTKVGFYYWCDYLYYCLFYDSVHYSWNS